MPQDGGCYAEVDVCGSADGTWTAWLYLQDTSIQRDGFASCEQALSWADREVRIQWKSTFGAPN